MDEHLSPNELIARFTYVLFKRKWSTLIISLVIFVGIVFGVYLIEPTYKATVLIFVRYSAQQQLILFQEMETPGPVNPQINPSRNLVEFANSRSVADQLVREFNLHIAKEPEDFREKFVAWTESATDTILELLDSWGIMELEEKDVVAEAIDKFLAKQLDIQAVMDTELINLTTWGPTPELSTDMANRMAELLVEKTRTLVQSQAESAYKFVNEQVQLAQASLQEADANFSRFKIQHGIVDIKDQLQLIQRRWDTLSISRASTQADLSEAHGRLQELQHQIELLEPTLLSSSKVSANPIMQDLKRTLNDLSTRLAAETVDKLDLHPEVVELQVQIAQLEQQLENEESMIPAEETTIINPVHQDLQRQLANADADVAAVQMKSDEWLQQISSLEQDIENLSQQEPEYERLFRERQSHQERYSTLKSKLLELEVQRVTTLSDFDIGIVDPASVSPLADSDYPDMTLTAGIALFAALVFALGIVFLREFLCDEVNTSDDLERSLKVAVLGSIPACRSGKMQDWQAQWTPSSPHVEK